MEFDLFTLPAFLVGNRDAIRAIAAAPHAPLVGLILVASAALARNYRTRWLYREPWPLFIPFIASTGVAVSLFAVLYVRIALHDGALPPASPLFLSFLGVYWCTAPLAWLYALPFERLFAPDEAVLARLRMLGVVATWRVLLMSRAVSVLTDCGPLDALALVMLVAGAVAITLLSRTRISRAASTPSLGDAMAGVPGYSPASRRPGQYVREVVLVLGWLSMPLWLVGAALAAPRSQTWREVLNMHGAVSPFTWLFASSSVVCWLTILPFAQLAQRRRWHVEAAYRAADASSVITTLSARAPIDYPPGWTPPPVSEFREPPTLLSLVECAMSPTAAPWVRDVYLEKFRSMFAQPMWFWEYDDELARVIAILEQLPDARALASQAVDVLEKSNAEIAEFHRQWASQVAQDSSANLAAARSHLQNLVRVRPAAQHSDQRTGLVRRFYEIAGRLPVPPS